MKVTRIVGRGGLALAMLLGLLVAAVGTASADHNQKAEATVSLPAAGKFQVCVGAGPTKAGKCDSSPLIAAGTLTIRIKGSLDHTSQFNVDRAPAECGTAPGVKITRTAGTTGGRVDATIQGTGSLGQVSQTVGPVSVSRNTDEIFAYACLEL